MVSSTIQQPAKVATPTYAERAKKAQNIISSISPSNPTRIVSQRPAVPSDAKNSSIASTASSTTSSNTISSSRSTDDTPNSSVIIATRASSPVPSSGPNDVADTKTVNGVKSSADLAYQALSIVAAHTAPPKPVVNVWAARKEKMAAAHAASSAPKPGASTISSTNFPLPSSMSSPQRSREPLSSSSTKIGQTQNSVPPLPNGATIGKAREATIVEDGKIDTLGVRPPEHLRPPQSAPLLSHPEAWPEVGKNLPAQPNGSSSQPPHADAKHGNGHSGSISTPSTTPKKNKWVPIPAKELQAAADAIQRSHSRKTPSYTPKSSHSPQLVTENDLPSQHPSPNSNSAAILPHTRPQSGRNSANHSRVQSRSGSTQSSPRVSRGRRLPTEDSPGLHASSGIPEASTNIKPSPSVTSVTTPVDPPVQAHPSSQILASNALVSPLHPSASSRPGSNNSASSSPHQAPHQHPHQPPFHISAPVFHPQNKPNLPLGPSPVSPTSYPGPPTPPYPVYPVYNSYEYPQQQPPQGPSYPPFIPWNNAVPRHNSPLYPPASSQFISPPPMLDSQRQQPVNAVSQDSEPSSNLTSLNGSSPQNPVEISTTERNIDSATNGAREKVVVFGSIGLPGAAQSPSPPQPAQVRKEEEGSEKPFAKFSIGVDSTDSRLRSRPKDVSTKERTPPSNGEDNMETTTEDCEKPKPSPTSASQQEGPKWKFGTAGSPPPPEAIPQPAQVREFVPSVPSIGLLSSATVPATPMSPSQMFDLHGSTSLIFPPRTRDPGPPLENARLDTNSDLAVKDFGYGFGPASGVGYGSVIVQERLPRQQEWEQIREGGREGATQTEVLEEASPMPLKETEEGHLGGLSHPRGEHSGRSRRGAPFGGGGRGYGGGYGGRRGRGQSGFSRGYGRGQNRGEAPHPPSQRVPPPFTVTPPPHFQPLVPNLNELASPYYAHPQQHMAPFGPGFEPLRPPPVNTVISHSAPPVPVPRTSVSFPLDATRWYLLGQLEYYLSPQNMAQDFFLRQQMDSRGWIPISLIASFNRVKQLTLDGQLVTDVLSLSSVVQVRGNMVRMDGWESFVLPDAPQSTVDEGSHHFLGGSYREASQHRHQHANYQHHDVGYAVHDQMEPSQEAPALGHVDPGREAQVSVVSGGGDYPTATSNGGEAEEDDGEDEEEDDVVFVMGQEVGTWSPERRT